MQSNGTHLNFKSPIDALEKLMLVLAGCPESKVVEVSSVYTIGAQQGPPGGSDTQDIHPSCRRSCTHQGVAVFAAMQGFAAPSV